MRELRFQGAGTSMRRSEWGWTGCEALRRLPLLLAVMIAVGIPGSRAQAGELIYQSGFANPDDVGAVGGWSNIHCKGAVDLVFPSAWTCSEPCAEPFEPWAGYTVCDGNVDWDDVVNRTDTGTEREGSIRIWLYDEAGDGESVPTAYLTLFTEAVPEYPDVTSQLPPDFEFTPGYVYVFSAWVHTESVLSNPALGVDWLSGVDADGAPLVIPNGTYDDGQVERDTLPFPVDPIAAPWPAWNGWHRLEVPAVAPHGAVGARLRLLTRTVGDRFVPTTMAGGPGVPEFDPQPSSFWFDDVEVEEFPSLKFVANAGEAAWLDPDWTFLVPIGAEVVQPDVVEVVGGDGTASFVLASDASFCGELTLGVPPAVALTAVTEDVPETVDDERNVRATSVVVEEVDPSSGYTWYGFEYGGDAVGGCGAGAGGTISTEQTFEWLFLTASPAFTSPAALYYRFEWDTPGGTVQQPTQTVVLSPFTLPVLAPEDRPQRLRVDAMASTSLGIPNGDWPGYLDLLNATGVHSFTLDSSIQAAWKSAAYRAEVESVRDEAVGVHELGLRGLLAPFSYITADGPAAIDTTTVAKNALGQLPDASWDLCAGAANLPVDYEICVDPPETHYTDELDALCVAGEMGVAWIALDWEGRDQRTFCDPAVSQFMTLYADADEDGVLGEFRRGGTVDHGDDPRFFYARAGQTTCGAGSVGESVNLACDIVYDERDAKYEDYLAMRGKAIWVDAYRAVRAGLATAGVTSRPVLSQWDAYPGSWNVSMGYADFDLLYPQVFAAAAPVLYPNSTGGGKESLHNISSAGPVTRRAMLGALSLGADNLVPGGLEAAAPWPPDWPADVLPVGDTGPLSWDLLQVHTGNPDPSAAGVPGPYGWRAAHGLRSLRVTHPADGGTEPTPRYRRGGVAVQEGDQYVFSAVARREPDGSDPFRYSDLRPCVRVRWNDGGGAVLATSGVDCGLGESSSKWGRISVLSRAPSGAATADLELLTVGTWGVVWFDDLRFGRPNRVENAGMERGTAALPDGWNVPLLSFIGPWTDAAEVHGGSRSLGIVRGYGYTSPVSGSVYRTVPLLPPRITDFEGPVPYQLSAYVHTESVVGSPELSIRWLADDGVTELGEASALLPAPGGAWNEEVLSAEAPAEAVFAEVHLGVVDLAGGTVRFDDVDFRVDGPYVNPYVTAGWNGQEVDSRRTLEQLLEAFVGGAQAVTSFVFRGYSGQDLARVAQAATMLHAAQDIVADGRPIADESLYAVGTWPWDPWDPLQPRAMGMEFDDRVLVLVSY